MKNCMKCGGAKKMKAGGQALMTKTMPGYNANIRPKQMKTGGAKKYEGGGPMIPATTPTKAPVPAMKKGGPVKKGKNLAKMYGNPNKITRGDIITAAKKKK